jgi:hypothetical protein
MQHFDHHHPSQDWSAGWQSVGGHGVVHNGADAAGGVVGGGQGAWMSLQHAGFVSPLHHEPLHHPVLLSPLPQAHAPEPQPQLQPHSYHTQHTTSEAANLSGEPSPFLQMSATGTSESGSHTHTCANATPATRHAPQHAVARVGGGRKRVLKTVASLAPASLAPALLASLASAPAHDTAVGASEGGGHGTGAQGYSASGATCYSASGGAHLHPLHSAPSSSAFALAPPGAGAAASDGKAQVTVQMVTCLPLALPAANTEPRAEGGGAARGEAETEAWRLKLTQDLVTLRCLSFPSSLSISLSNAGEPV